MDFSAERCTATVRGGTNSSYHLYAPTTKARRDRGVVKTFRVVPGGPERIEVERAEHSMELSPTLGDALKKTSPAAGRPRCGCAAGAGRANLRGMNRIPRAMLSSLSLLSACGSDTTKTPAAAPAKPAAAPAVPAAKPAVAPAESPKPPADADMDP